MTEYVTTKIVERAGGPCLDLDFTFAVQDPVKAFTDGPQQVLEAVLACRSDDDIRLLMPADCANCAGGAEVFAHVPGEGIYLVTCRACPIGDEWGSTVTFGEMAIRLSVRIETIATEIVEAALDVAVDRGTRIRDADLSALKDPELRVVWMREFGATNRGMGVLLHLVHTGEALDYPDEVRALAALHAENAATLASVFSKLKPNLGAACEQVSGIHDDTVSSPQ